MDIAETIIYEDREILVLNKPAGVAVQTKRICEPDIESMLKAYLAAKGEGTYVGIVHRLDQPVEGILLFAKTGDAAAELNRRMRENGFQKYYYAVVSGSLPEQKGKLTDYMKKDGRTNLSVVCGRDEKGAKRARLSYEILQKAEVEGELRSLVHICLETGRHHQIRVQMAHAGCPLVGDCKYGAAGGDSGKREGIALCAHRLTFVHPRTGEKHDYAIEPSGRAFCIFFK